MKTRIIGTSFALMAGLLVSAQADPKEEVTAAIKKLAEAENYSWKSTSTSGPDRTTTTSGKASKDGWMHLQLPRRDSTMEAVVKGEKGAIKGDDGWQTLEEMEQQDQGQGEGRGRRGGFMGGMIRGYKAPTPVAEELLAATEGLEAADGAFTGKLSADGVKEMLTFRRRGGDDSAANAPTNTSGTVKYWVADGAVSKIEYTVKGTMSFNGQTRDIERTTTIEISDVGSTELAIPDDVKAKLAS